MSQQPGGRLYASPAIPLPLYLLIPLGLVLFPVGMAIIYWEEGGEKVRDWKEKRKQKKAQKRKATEKEIKLSANDSQYTL
jgi:hypothetical protein